MEYFKYAKTLKNYSPYRSQLIYEAVYSQDMKYYAMKIYGGGYEDALDLAFQHVLENFDSEKGDLVNYTTTIVKTINLGAYRHEVSQAEVLDILSDKVAFNSNNGDPLNELLKEGGNQISTEVSDCVSFMLPNYILDYKFFKTRKSTDRTQEYAELFKKFNANTIMEANQKLDELYELQVAEVYDIKRQMRFRSHEEGWYKKYLDPSIEYICERGGIIVYRKNKNKIGKASNKFFYELNIRDLVATILDRLYKTNLLRKRIGWVTVYCSLSGKLVLNEYELYDILERDLVGCILSKQQSLGVLKYEQGEKIVLVSSRESLQEKFSIIVLEESFDIELVLKSAKCVER